MHTNTYDYSQQLQTFRIYQFGHVSALSIVFHIYLMMKHCLLTHTDTKHACSNNSSIINSYICMILAALWALAWSMLTIEHLKPMDET